MTRDSHQPEQEPASTIGDIGHSGPHGEGSVYRFRNPDGSEMTLQQAIDQGLVHSVQTNPETDDVVVTVPSSLGQHRDPSRTATTPLHAPLYETSSQEQDFPRSRKKSLIIGGAVLASVATAGALLFGGLKGDGKSDADNARPTPSAGPVTPSPETPSSTPTERLPLLDARIIPTESISISGENSRQELFETVQVPFERATLDKLVNKEFFYELRAESDDATFALDSLYPLDPYQMYENTSVLQSEIFTTDKLNPWRTRGIADTYVKPIDFPTTKDLSGDVTDLARKLIAIPDAFSKAGFALYADAYANKAPANEREFAVKLTRIGRMTDPQLENEAVILSEYQAAEIAGTLDDFVEETLVGMTRKLDVGNAELLQVRENPFNNSGFIEEGEPTSLEISLWVQTKDDVRFSKYTGKIVIMQLTSAPVKGNSFQGFIVNETDITIGPKSS